MYPPLKSSLRSNCKHARRIKRVEFLIRTSRSKLQLKETQMAFTDAASRIPDDFANLAATMVKMDALYINSVNGLGWLKEMTKGLDCGGKTDDAVITIDDENDDAPTIEDAQPDEEEQMQQQLCNA